MCFTTCGMLTILASLTLVGSIVALKFHMLWKVDVIFEVEDIIKKNVFTVLLIAAIAGFVAGALAIASNRCKKGITRCINPMICGACALALMPFIIVCGISIHNWALPLKDLEFAYCGVEICELPEEVEFVPEITVEKAE